MSLWVLYLVLLKATVTAFSGLSTLPVLRDELVVRRQVLTDRDLNTAVVIGRTTPGPKGFYVVSVGHYVAGASGAVIGWLALVTPALLIIPLLQGVGRYAGHPRAKAALRNVVLASAGVSLSATLPLAADALRSPVDWVLAAVALAVLVATKLDTLWVIAGAAVMGVLLR